METHARTIAKAITWRVVGLSLTVLAAWMITRRASVAATVGLADTLLKIGAFYLHERLWLRIDFGRESPRLAAKPEEAAA